MSALPVKRKKSVLVIGGGPAGMEAARVAVLRGHKVTLWEKGHALGGNLIPAAVPEFKLDYRCLLDYLTTQVRKLGIETKLGLEATGELVQRMNPDVVVIATGATPIIPDIPGIERGIETGRVFTCVDALLGKKEVGRSVVIIGGGLIGCETGLWLAQKGKKVTVIARHAAMRDMYWINAKDVQEKLDETGAKVLAFTNILEITNDGVVISSESGVRSVLEADTILVAVRLEPNRELLDALADKPIPEVYPIGDCVESRIVLDAIWEGFRTARLI
jgi:2-enoate reductase